MHRYFKIFIYSIILSFAFLPFLAQAQSVNNSPASNSTNTTSSVSGKVDNSIDKYLCTPGSTTGIIACIQKGYKFVLTISIAASVLLLVFAGYLYITGTEQSVSQAKSVIGTTVAGLAILLLTYVILKQINPELVTFKELSPFDIRKEAGVTFQQTNPTSPNGTTTSSGATTGDGKYCINNPGSCINLKDISVPTSSSLDKNHSYVLAALGNKLKNVNPGISWRVNEAYPPTVPHIDSCHQNASCVDLGMDNKTVANWNALCKALKAAGLTHIANEASPGATECGPYKTYSSTTGANLHVELY